MRKALLLILAMSVLAKLPAAVAARCDSPLGIGAWNIEWLGAAQRDAIGHQAPADIAGYISAAKVDVLALTEISVTRNASGKAINLQLEQALALLDSQGAAWQYRLFDKHPMAAKPNDQWTGLAWNTHKVQLTGGPWNVAGVDEQRRIELLGAKSGEVVLNRTPYAVKLSAGEGRSDFLFVPLHLKANSGKPTQAQRELEVHLILKGVEALRAQTGEQDVVLLGDANMLDAGEPAAKLLGANGLRDCNQLDQATWLSTDPAYPDAPFDRIFVMRDQPETQATCREGGDPALAFKVVTPGDWVAGMSAQAFRQRLSDHQMVRAAVCIGPDDD
ncbi:hypothetical protein KSS94_09820 [Pseudomonas fakonensis]|uniref:Endonuclease/Exonuclease/phosphatase family protein n=1 Tax=Pseudomonas fakonensis TaxID=2842355 RepID=A0ABX8NC48_9PSED|nr:hypothetical protein [Pseudomonas fakonensis]QXH53385.1 hypothetical protein KSS94_09820 [Pseudomonas fakonensis]